MKNEWKLSVHRLTACGIVACLYAVLTISTAALSYGPVQFRLAEALCVLPFFAPWMVWGVTLGCLLANLFSTVSALDVVVGTLATLIAGILTSRCKRTLLAPLPPVICNSVIVGAMLAWVCAPEAFWSSWGLFALEVGAGEAAVCYLVGLPLLILFRRQGLDTRLRDLP